MITNLCIYMIEHLIQTTLTTLGLKRLLLYNRESIAGFGGLGQVAVRRVIQKPELLNSRMSWRSQSAANTSIGKPKDQAIQNRAIDTEGSLQKDLQRSSN